MGVFGDTLRELREKRGLTVNQLAIYSGVSSALISKIENNKRGIPKPKTIEKIAKGLKMDYNDLMVLAGHYDEKSKSYADNEEEFLEDINILSVEDVIKKYNIKIDGKELSEEEAKIFLISVRTNRSMQ